MSDQVKATAIKMRVDPTADGSALKFGIEFLVDGTGEKVWVNFTSKGGGEKIAKEVLNKMGWNGDLENASFSSPTQTLYSTLREWGGRERVEWHVSTKESKPRQPVDPDLKQAFLTSFRASFGDPTPVAKPPTPPPAPPVPKPAPKKPVTMEAAWAEFSARSGGTDNQKAKDWEKCITEVSTESGLSWEKFTPDQWQAVVEMAIPV